MAIEYPDLTQQQINDLVTRVGGMKRVTLLLNGYLEITEAPLLKKVHIMEVGAQEELIFTPQVMVDNARWAKTTNDDFNLNFLGKVERNVPAGILWVHQVKLKPAIPFEIMRELDKRVEIPFVYLDKFLQTSFGMFHGSGRRLMAYVKNNRDEQVCIYVTDWTIRCKKLMNFENFEVGDYVLSLGSKRDPLEPEEKLDWKEDKN